LCDHKSIATIMPFLYRRTLPTMTQDDSSRVDARIAASLQLTRLQLSSAIVGMQEFIKLLQKETADDPQGGQHEDIVIAQSVLRELIRAKNAPATSV
jgi:hypothetical protein